MSDVASRYIPTYDLCVTQSISRKYSSARRAWLGNGTTLTILFLLERIAEKRPPTSARLCALRTGLLPSLASINPPAVPDARANVSYAPHMVWNVPYAPHMVWNVPCAPRMVNTHLGEL